MDTRREEKKEKKKRRREEERKTIMFGEKNTNWGEDTIEDKNEGKQNERVGGRKEENKS